MAVRTRRALAIALTLPALVAAGCGGDDEDGSKAGTSSVSSAPAPAPSTDGGAETTMAPDGTPTTRTQPPSSNGAATSPSSSETQPGGAGDEVPNSTQALLTGRGGKISPPTVAVPPFIAITVELRSADGDTYKLSGGGKSLSAAGGKPATASFDGLRTGKSITLNGPQGAVKITANAEPGP